MGVKEAMVAFNAMFAADREKERIDDEERDGYDWRAYSSFPAPPKSVRLQPSVSTSLRPPHVTCSTPHIVLHSDVMAGRQI